MWRNAFGWQGDPTSVASKVCLNVRLLGVRDLDTVTRETNITVGSPRSIHGGREIYHVLKHGNTQFWLTTRFP